jgi:hypothetical protein
MQIDPKATLDGTRLIDIRRLFRRAGLDGLLSPEFIQREMEVDARRARRLMRSLKTAGFIEPDEERWRLTKEGGRLRAATSARPLLRTTADRLLQTLLNRIELLNRHPDFMARVERAIVFGSYLSNADRLGDLDVAIQWQRREPNYDKHVEANSKRVMAEMKKGRHFSNIVEELCWWQREAILFLKNRKRGLSIHDYASEKKVVDSVPNRVVYPFEPKP